ncbi:MAG: choice-of-anchor J domain-containing protein [Rikenellaceae bacterium]
MKRLAITTFAMALFTLSASAQSYFTPKISSVDPATALTKNGVENMEWISFAGEPFVNGKQIKNGWGKSSSGNTIDFIGVNVAGLPSEEYTNQNNDWLISDEIDLSGATAPVISFDLFYNYGVDNTNTLAVYVCTSGYESGATAEGNDVKATPSGEWVVVKKSIFCNEPKVAENVTISLSDYAGQKIRFAFRATNRLKQNINNSRMYNISNLEVKEK